LSGAAYVKEERKKGRKTHHRDTEDTEKGRSRKQWKTVIALIQVE